MLLYVMRRRQLIFVFFALLAFFFFPPPLYPVEGAMAGFDLCEFVVDIVFFFFSYFGRFEEKTGSEVSLT